MEKIDKAFRCHLVIGIWSLEILRNICYIYVKSSLKRIIEKTSKFFPTKPI